MKQACALLIKKCALVHFPVHQTSTADDWQNLLEECLGHEIATVKLKSAEAHAAFLNEYYTDATISKEQRANLVNRYLGQLKSNHQTVRIGFAQAIGKTSKTKLQRFLKSRLSNFNLNARWKKNL